MRSNNDNLLIEEEKLRAALQPWRGDRAAFEAGVLQRVEALKVSRRLEATSPSSMSDWRRIAASVMPPVLLGNSSNSETALSLAQVSLLKKLIGMAALPAIGWFLMIGSAVLGFAGIRQAGRNQQTGDVDFINLQNAQRTWWKKYGWGIGGVFIVSLVLPIFGYAFVFPLLLGSAVAMVSLVRSLSKDGVVNRRAIGGSLAMGLTQLAGVANIGVIAGSGIHLLDQSLVTAVLFVGVCVILAMQLRIGNAGRSVLTLFAVCLLIMLSSRFAQSLWNPITVETVREYVEAFDTAPHSSASWEQWEVPTAWLVDSDVELDLSKPRKLLEQELNGDQNPYILSSAYRAGLMHRDDIARLRDLEREKISVVYESDPASKTYELLRAAGKLGRPIPSIVSAEFVVNALVMSDQLSEPERDLLERRLVATFKSIEEHQYHGIEDALAVTRLLMLIGRTDHLREFRDAIHHRLVNSQTTKSGGFTTAGGFANLKDPGFSDDGTTAAAVELMQYYGVPDGTSISALRSCLRPSMYDRPVFASSALRPPVHAAIRMRLESLSDVPPVTLLDYLRFEMNLWMAVLLVLLCCYATLSAPHRNLGDSVGDVKSQTDEVT